MADLTYTMDINGAPALTTLNKVESQISKLKGSFSALGTALGSIAFGAMISSTIKFADSISDLSDATEISIQKVLGFSAAVQANGGTAEGAQKGMAKLVASIDEAANTAGSGRDAFNQVGVSLSDLRTKTSSQIFEQAIKGLAGITDVATRARVATELLGKEAKLINFKNVAADFDEASAKAARYSSAIKSGADANDNIAAAIRTLQLELLKAIQPITDFINSVKVSTDTLSRFFDIMAEAAKWAILVAGLTLIGRGLYVLGTAAVAAYGAITNLAGGIVGLFRALSNPLTRSNLMLTLEELHGKLGPKVIVVLNAMGINTAFLAKHWLSLSAAIGGAVGALKEYLGFGKDEEGPKGRSYSEEDAKRQQQYLDEKAATIKRGREEMEKDALAQIKISNDLEKALSKIRVSYIQLGEESQHNNDTLVGNLQFETSLVGKTEEQVELARALRAEADSLIKLKDGLAKKAQEINAEIVTELELQKKLNQLQIHDNSVLQISKDKDIEASKNKVIVLQSEKAEIDKLTGVYQNFHNKNGAAIEKYITQQQTLKLLEKDRLQNIENITKAIEDQVARQQTLAGILQGINDKKVDMAFELKIKDFTPLEKQFAQIDENARKAALEAARSFAAGFADVDMTAEKTKELADGLEQIANSYKGIADAQIRNLEYSRTWSAGWKTAFDSYMDNATNAAKQAGDVFNAITSNMNSAIDNFVENGKFSFEDLAKSIIKDLIKIELKAQAVKLLGMLGGGGGILSSIGKFLGFYAEGGNPPINKPSIVGEKGPELFVPRSAGTIIPNGAGGGGVVNKTYITNNISAIDSKSVAQMFAENRKALLGTVQLAQKELPYGNR